MNNSMRCSTLLQLTRYTIIHLASHSRVVLYRCPAVCFSCVLATFSAQPMTDFFHYFISYTRFPCGRRGDARLTSWQLMHGLYTMNLV